jgi:hypothetical protein
MGFVLMSVASYPNRSELFLVNAIRKITTIALLLSNYRRTRRSLRLQSFNGTSLTSASCDGRRSASRRTGREIPARTGSHSSRAAELRSLHQFLQTAKHTSGNATVRETLTYRDTRPAPEGGRIGRHLKLRCARRAESGQAITKWNHGGQ